MMTGMGGPELLTIVILIVIVIHLCLNIDKRVERVAGLFDCVQGIHGTANDRKYTYSLMLTYVLG